MKKYILPLLVLALSLTACSTPAAEVTPTPTPTEQVTPTPGDPAPEADSSLFVRALLGEAASVQRVSPKYEYGTGQFIAQSRSAIESTASQFFYALRAQLESLEDIDFSVFWDPEAEPEPLQAFLDEVKSYRSEQFPVTWANVRVDRLADYSLEGLEGERVAVAYHASFALFCPKEKAAFRFGGLPMRLTLTFVCRDRCWYLSSIEELPDTDDASEPMGRENARYFFSEGDFMGAWSDGQWLSCETEEFTLGEIFNRDYYDLWGGKLGSVRISMSGPGSFDEIPNAWELLKPFGIMEGHDFIMALPGQLTGEAARMTAPNYNFYALFDGQSDPLVSSVPVKSLSLRKTDILPADEALVKALKEAGIRCDPDKMDRTALSADLDGDGEAEYVELIRTPQDSMGYAILERGDQCFYAILLRDGEEISVVASRAIGYTDDVTSHFTAGDIRFSDLDGDGMCEILYTEFCWEWGSRQACSLVDGMWTEVLRSNSGM